MNHISLSTTRLQLRPVEDSDLQAIHLLHSLPESVRYNTLGIPRSAEETRMILADWIKERWKKKPENYVFALELKEDASFLGLIALKLNAEKYKSGEMWYKLYPTNWGKGYATEAVKEVIQFGFQNLQLHRLEAGCAVENKASVRVMEKAGMTLEGRKRALLPLENGWNDCFDYAILSIDPA